MTNDDSTMHKEERIDIMPREADFLYASDVRFEKSPFPRPKFPFENMLVLPV